MSDLTAPLGFKAPGEDRAKRPIGAIFAFGMVALAALIGLWVVAVDDPLGGEPVAVARIADVDEGVDRSEITTVGVKSGAGELLPPIDGPARPAEADDGAIAAVAPPGEPVRDADPARMPVVADPELIAQGPYGPVPKVAADGRRPLDVYSRPVPSVVGSAPKVVIVVGGLGLSQTGTQEALRQLPPEVTLAFAPYGSSLDRWSAKARQNGHELLLQVPLEPFDYPDNDPGPHTLLTALDGEKNVDRMHWLFARLGTYVGVVTYMGARFTADGRALDPVMGELATRGLLFLDDGTSSRSVADTVAKDRATPYAKADLVIDAVPTEAEIVGRLAQLEQIARTRGIAVGTASALPVSVREIAEWAKTLDARGITLVPVSATQRAR